MPTPAATVKSPIDEPLEAETDTTLEKPPHNRHLARTAAALGFTDEQIAGMSSDELSEAIHEETLARAGERRAAPSSRPAEPKPEEPPEEDYDAEIDALEDIDPKVVGLLKKIAGKAKLTTAIQKRLDAAETRELTTHQLARAEKIDNAFEALGEEYETLFGTGSVLDEDFAKTPEGKRRAAIFREAGIDFVKLPGPATLKRKLLEAAKTFFPSAAKPKKKAAETVYEEDGNEDDEVLEDEAPAPKPKPRGKDGQYTKEDFEEGGLRRPTHREPKKDGTVYNLDDAREKFIALEKKAGRNSQ